MAAKIATDKELIHRAIQIMATEELNNVFPFTHELATKVENPIEAFQIAVDAFESSTDKKGIQFICGLLSGIDKRDSQASEQCIQIALESDALKNQGVNIYRAVNISIERLNEIVRNLKGGSITARDCVHFSYGRGLDHLSSRDILPFIDELASNQGAEGAWTALKIIYM